MIERLIKYKRHDKDTHFAASAQRRLLGVLAMLIGASLLHGQLTRTRRTDLQRHDLSAIGREVIQVRVEFDPGVTAPRHTHPGEEIIYVLEGKLQYDIDGQPQRTVRPGDVLFVPSGTPHSVTNVGSGNGAELATYVVEKGKPLITLVK